MTRSAPSRSSAGQRRELSARPLRGMRHEHAQVGREARGSPAASWRSARPAPPGGSAVGGRRCLDARGASAPRFSRRSRPAPGSSCRAPCRRPGRRRGRGARGTRASGRRSPGTAGASVAERPADLAAASASGVAQAARGSSRASVPGDHPGPVARGLRRRGRLCRPRSPSRPAGASPRGRRGPARAARRALLPVAEDLAQLLAVELHPLAPHEGEAVRAGEELAPLRVGEGLAVEGQRDREVEQRIQAQSRPAACRRR